MKKLFKKIGLFIDSSGKVISRIKNIAVLVIVILLAISIISNGCNRQEANELFERVTGLNVQNDILKKNIKQRRQDIIKKDSIITEKNNQIAVKEMEYDDLKAELNDLKKQRENIPEEIIKLPTDSSYEYLTKVAYPFPGELKYPFNEPQVKAFHVTYFERISLLKENKVLTSLMENSEDRLLLKESVFREVDSKYNLAVENLSGYEEMIDNKDEIIILQKEEIDKKNNKNLLCFFNKFHSL